MLGEHPWERLVDSRRLLLTAQDDPDQSGDHIALSVSDEGLLLEVGQPARLTAPDRHQNLAVGHIPVPQRVYTVLYRPGIDLVDQGG